VKSLSLTVGEKHQNFVGRGPARVGNGKGKFNISGRLRGCQLLAKGGCKAHITLGGGVPT